MWDEKADQTQAIGGQNTGDLTQFNGDGNTFIKITTEAIENFEQENILSNTIKYILKENNFTFDYAEEINSPTTLENKIIVNGINSSLKAQLISGRAKRYLIEELFDENQEFDIEILRKDILKMYERHRKTLDDMNKIIQKLYHDILEKFKKRDANTSISIFIIIAYFFEICDVGDNPNDITQ